jgi:drug/metabolite transporter (DMT)-like permease
MSVDPGPIILVYYSLCAVSGAAAGMLTGVYSRLGAGGKLITTIVGAIGGIGAGLAVATVPTPPPGKGSDALIIGGLMLFTGLCGWLLAFVATRLLRHSRG